MTVPNIWWLCHTRQNSVAVSFYNIEHKKGKCAFAQDYVIYQDYNNIIIIRVIDAGQCVRYAFDDQSQQILITGQPRKNPSPFLFRWFFLGYSVFFGNSCSRVFTLFVIAQTFYVLECLAHFIVVFSTPDIIYKWLFGHYRVVRRRRWW